MGYSKRVGAASGGVLTEEVSAGLIRAENGCSEAEQELKSSVGFMMDLIQPNICDVSGLLP